MSLKVYAYRRARPEADLEFLAPRSPANELAGAESARHGFWSHEALVRRGLRVLPSLHQVDIYAEGSELRQLEHEVATIRNEFAEIVRETAQDPVWVHFRLENIESAIAIACEVDGIGGVYIG